MFGIIRLRHGYQMNMIEKVAIAIGGLENDRCNPCTNARIIKCKDCLEAAKRSIEAMKEPTEEMLKVSEDHAIGINYKLMIEAALKD